MERFTLDEAALDEIEKKNEDPAEKKELSKSAKRKRKGKKTTNTHSRVPETPVLDHPPPSPAELFTKYAKEGKLDFESFYELACEDLPIDLPKPKAAFYFKRCDTRSRGYLSYKEFQILMYICNPSDQSNPVGFSPVNLLMPRDLFHKVAKRQSESISLEEFQQLCKLLNNPKFAKADVIENLFEKYVQPGEKNLSYENFRTMWLTYFCDVREELKVRGVRIRPRTPIDILMSKLETILLQQEDDEDRAIRRAEWWESTTSQATEHRQLVQEVIELADAVLIEALDAAGQVYVFGTGPNRCFLKEPAEPKSASLEFLHYQRILKLWKARIQPANTQRENPFQGLQVAVNTVWLWGRSISQIDCSRSTAFALTRSGQLFSWGGNSTIWEKLNPIAELTPRSSMLRMQGKAKEKTAACSEVAQLSQFNLIQKEQQNQTLKLSPKQEHQRVLVLAKYYDLPVGADYENFVARLNIKHLQYSLQLRGFAAVGLLKLQLLENLLECICLEKECMGETFHDLIRQYDQKIRSAFNQCTPLTAINRIFIKTHNLWAPLKQLRQELVALETQEQEETRELELQQQLQCQKRLFQQARREIEKNIKMPNNKLQKLDVQSLTPRGFAQQARCYQPQFGLQAIAVGASHAIAISQTGQLYAWGDNTFGRLGTKTHKRISQIDSSSPAVVPSVEKMRFQSIACGHSHSAAITLEKSLFMWGNAATGKLGVELPPPSKPTESSKKTWKEMEYTCIRPEQVQFQTKERIRQVACGAGHSACVTLDGRLFVWGCADGGRLGLGERQSLPHQIDRPTFVKQLKQYHVVKVACGIVHTAVITKISNSSSNSRASATGGLVFVAGNIPALVRATPAFEVQESLRHTPICEISCGNAHTAAVTLDGELYTWGENLRGAAAHPVRERRIPFPKRVSCFYHNPSNVALNCPASQRTINPESNLDPQAAVSGDRRGDTAFQVTQTLYEDCPYWDLDLQHLHHVDRICIFNRTNPPSDTTDLYYDRLFPCFVFISDVDFPTHLAGRESIEAGKQQSIDFAKFVEKKDVLEWKLSSSLNAVRYVRVQLAKLGILNLAQVEVYGTPKEKANGPKVAQVICGQQATIVLCRQASDPNELEKKYHDAVQVDSSLGSILMKFEVYYDSFAREQHSKEPREDADKEKKKCRLCSNTKKCCRCALDKAILRQNRIPREKLVTLPLEELCRDFLKVNESAECPHPEAQELLIPTPEQEQAVASTSSEDESDEDSDEIQTKTTTIFNHSMRLRLGSRKTYPINSSNSSS